MISRLADTRKESFNMPGSAPPWGYSVFRLVFGSCPVSVFFPVQDFTGSAFKSDYLGQVVLGIVELLHPELDGFDWTGSSIGK